MSYWALNDRVLSTLGPARNSWIDAACGEYVGFVDSDDWVDSDMYKGLLDRARETGADAVFSEMKTICGGERVADFPVIYVRALKLESWV